MARFGFSGTEAGHCFVDTLQGVAKCSSPQHIDCPRNQYSERRAYNQRDHRPANRAERLYASWEGPLHTTFLGIAINRLAIPIGEDLTIGDQIMLLFDALGP